MSYTEAATIRLGVCDGDSVAPNTPERWYYLSPGCSFQRTMTKDDIDIGIPEINNFIEDIGLSANDTITLNTKLTYDHNNEDPWLTIQKLYWEVKHRKDPGSTTAERHRYILQIGNGDSNHNTTAIDTTTNYYPNDYSFYCMVNEITVNIEPGGKLPELTIRLKPTNTHDQTVSV